MRVEIVAALEGTVRVVYPLVKVAHHIEDAVFVRALRALACSRQRPLQLIETRIVHVPCMTPHPVVFGLSVEHWIENLHGTAAVVVTAAHLAVVPVRKHGLFRANTGLLPFVGFAEPLCALLAGSTRLNAADMRLWVGARSAYRTDDNVGGYRLVVRPGLLGPVRHPPNERSLVRVDAVRAIDQDHPVRTRLRSGPILHPRLGNTRYKLYARRLDRPELLVCGARVAAHTDDDRHRKHRQDSQFSDSSDGDPLADADGEV